MQENYSKLLQYMSTKPTVYAKSSSAFWDDEHISKYMLNAHLNVTEDAASRNLEFMKNSADWIKHDCGNNKHKLLNLGCGPGIYAELFADRGFEVTGIDISKRSISYAIKHANDNE